MSMGDNVAGQKRKAVSHSQSRNLPKRRKTDIPRQDASTGSLNIPNFIRAREFEIKALESSMQKSRKGLMSRAFQQLPRHMRRRTASHNVKKVPKRLRKRAVKEMRNDNTPTVTRRTRPISRKLRMRYETAKLLKKLNLKAKHHPRKTKTQKSDTGNSDPEKHVVVSRIPRIKKNTLANPPKATSKYKRRQVNKTWLPTHLWHTKRAHMTRPTEPLWQMAIPLRPTEKSYRPSHRAGGARGCIAWDSSYFSTVGCLGTDHALENMLKLLGFVSQGPAGRLRKWKAGTRHAEGWFYEIERSKKPIGRATVIWIVKGSSEVDSGERVPVDTQPAANTANSEKNQHKVKLDRRLFLRVHPSAFQQFWTELLKAAKMQKPQVLVEDLRFEIGSIQITGPGATEALVGVLKPRHTPSEGSAEQIWTSLAALNNPASLLERCLLAFDILDPRLSHPPKQIKVPRTEDATNELNELIVSWPVDRVQTVSNLSQHKARWIASTQLPSQQAINRRRTSSGKGRPIPVVDKDPAIPVILLANRPSSSDANAQGSWTVLLPWCCVDSVWRSLMYYPLSTGGTPRFGGLNQTQQLAFEHMTPWYPGDYPGTAAGQAWENYEAEKRFDAWVRRPPSRRLAWDMLELGRGRRGEIGRGWTCDWEYLFKDTDKPLDSITTPVVGGKQDGTSGPISNKSKQQLKRTKKISKPEKPEPRRRNTSSPESDAGPDLDLPSPPDEPILFIQVTPSPASSLLKPHSTAMQPSVPAIATVRIRLLSKGTPKPGARIYRLPSPTSTVPCRESAPVPTQASTHPPNSNATSESAPPPGQPSPPVAVSAATPNPSTTPSLRDKWLSLLPSSFYTTSSSGSNTRPSPTTIPNSTLNHSNPTKKPRVNHRNLPPKHSVHPPDPPTHITVLPRNAPQKIIDQFLPEPSASQIADQQREEERKNLMAELIKNDGPLADDQWDVTKGLVECPDAVDLIGFVTSGGFNLAVGHGTAVGGVWVQRVMEGWKGKEEEKRGHNEGRGTGHTVTGEAGTASVETHEGTVNENERPSIISKKTGGNGKVDKMLEKEKYLCVVRNAGESVGRLGVWEVCT